MSFVDAPLKCFFENVFYQVSVVSIFFMFFNKNSLRRVKGSLNIGEEFKDLSLFLKTSRTLQGGQKSSFLL